MQHPARQPSDQLLVDCDIRTGKRSGPGGQHRNKVETAVRIVHRPSRVRVEASERRSQADNRQQAIHRLRLKLATVVRCPANKQRSELWQHRVRNGKLSVAIDHPDYPAILSEVLDVLSESAMEPAAAATLLGISASQVVRLLRRYPPALSYANQKRQSLGLHALR